jgi:hypothetical protein
MKKIKYDAVAALVKAGVAKDDAVALRRISLTLCRWFEHECNGTIQRDETTGKPHSYREDARGVHHKSGIVPDREAGAMKRLRAIMARYPSLTHYVQGDPRGCALYILRPGDVPEGELAESYYSRGVAVY